MLVYTLHYTNQLLNSPEGSLTLPHLTVYYGNLSDTRSPRLSFYCYHTDVQTLVNATAVDPQSMTSHPSSSLGIRGTGKHDQRRYGASVSRTKAPTNGREF